MIRAAEAREKAVGATSKSLLAWLEGCDVEVRAAAARGCTSISLEPPPYELRAAVIDRLQKLGYTTAFHDDQRDGSSLTVSW